MSDTDQELYTDIIITAVEGGINYWAKYEGLDDDELDHQIIFSAEEA